MADSNSDAAAQAADRLEAAIDRLAAALAAPRPAGDAGIPRAEVLALAGRLESTIARLRGTLREAVPGDDEDEEG
jgi:hypothetical protein